MVPSGRETVQIQSTNTHNHVVLLQSSAQGITLNYDTLNVPATQACSASAPEERKNHDEGEIALGNAVPAQM